MKNVLTFESFVEWLERQPKHREYPGYDWKNCAICQYLDHLGMAYQSATYDAWRETEDGEWHDLVPDLSILANHPQTFGAAAERARDYLRSAK